MKVDFVANDRSTVADALQEMLQDAEEVRVAVAYARETAFDELPALVPRRRRGPRVQFLAGVDFQLTDLAAVERLHDPPRSEGKLYWILPGSLRQNFHPKLYLARRADTVRALVGSSNLTGGGLRKNLEANLRIEGAASEPVLRDLVGFHESLWNSSCAVPISPELRSTYERLRNRKLSAERELRREPDFDRANRQFELAVSDAISSFAGSRGNRTWLMITSAENYYLCKKRLIWGDERHGRVSQLQPGDILIFYISKLQHLGMMGLVTEGVFEDRTPFWGDRVYPYRIRFLPLAEPSADVLLPDLVPRLRVFADVDPKHWGQKLQTSQRELPAADAELLRRAILDAASLTRSA